MTGVDLASLAARLREGRAPIALPPDVVYHYTSPAGLLGIIRTRRIWASHFAFLNDPSELATAHAGALGAMKKAFAIGHPLLQELEMFIERLFRPEAVNQREAFIASFSAESDSLPQWRAYANNTQGYALGFSLDPSHWRLAATDFRPRPCTYGEDALRGTLGREVQRLTTLANEVQHLPRSASAWNDIRGELIRSLLECLSCFKDAAFRTEAEWRFVGGRLPWQDGDRIEEGFRPSQFGLTPYVELPFQASALREVWIGPGLPQPHAEVGLRALLLAPDTQHVRVCVSGTRHR